MPLISTQAIILSALRYSETSKIVRLATREHGVQSAIAKGALRPRSRYGAALQVLSEGQAQYLGLYATATALGEVMLRFAPAAPHPESYDVFRDALAALEHAPADDVEALGFRLLW